MAYDEHLAARVRSLLGRRVGLTEKKMFGGVGFLLHGHMCLGIWKDSLIARIGADAYDTALQTPSARPFDITGRPMRGWILVEPEGIIRDEQLRDWCHQAIEFVVTLPPKP